VELQVQMAQAELQVQTVLLVLVDQMVLLELQV